MEEGRGEKGRREEEGRGEEEGERRGGRKERREGWRKGERTEQGRKDREKDGVGRGKIKQREKRRMEGGGIYPLHTYMYCSHHRPTYTPFCLSNHSFPFCSMPRERLQRQWNVAGSWFVV